MCERVCRVCLTVCRQYVGKAYNILQRFVCQDNGTVEQNSIALYRRREDYVRHICKFLVNYMMVTGNILNGKISWLKVS